MTAIGSLFTGYGGLDHVTEPWIGLSRVEQLTLLGNGVVPQQAAEALRRLLPHVGAVAS